MIVDLDIDFSIEGVRNWLTYFQTRLKELDEQIKRYKQALVVTKDAKDLSIGLSSENGTIHLCESDFTNLDLGQLLTDSLEAVEMERCNTLFSIQQLEGTISKIQSRSERN